MGSFTFAAALAAATLTFVCHSGTLRHAAPTFDDGPALLNNPVVNGQLDGEFLAALWERDFWGAPLTGSAWTHRSFRPLTTALWRGAFLASATTEGALRGLHRVNVALHSLCAALVVPVTGRLLGRGRELARQIPHW